MEVHIDGFEEMLRRVVREELAASRDGWLDSKDAAEYVGVSLGTLHNAVSEGRLPRHGERGQRLRFQRAELDAYMEARR